MSLDDFNICLFEGKVREIRDEEFEHIFDSIQIPNARNFKR